VRIWPCTASAGLHRHFCADVEKLDESDNVGVEDKAVATFADVVALLYGVIMHRRGKGLDILNSARA
jgi:hypothetical protein